VATLLAVHRPGGRTQRCDARCYQATPGSECECVCEGANHARGLQDALVLTRKQYEQWIEQARRQDPEITRIEIGLEVQQIDLFDLVA
jgi:hypothetical protein